MGKLIRRDKATPVDVRRSDPAQELIDIPNGQRPPVPPTGQPAGPVTTNIFYVSAPPGSPPPQAAVGTQPPQEIHYHTTVHHAPRTYRPARGLSFLGAAAMVLGTLACAAMVVPGARSFVHPLAVAGAASACLGLLGSILLGRTGSGVPFLGLLISGAAQVWLMHDTGQLPKIDLELSVPAAAPTTQKQTPAK